MLKTDVINMIVLSGLFLALFGAAEFLYHVLKWQAEWTRKIVHFGTGFLTFLFPLMLRNQWFVLILCSTFAVLLILSLRFKWFPSINAIDRYSIGSLAYPISVYSCYLVFSYLDKNYIYYYLPILILAICDPLAALFGKRWPYGKFKVGEDYKTLVGSFTFLISAIVLTLFFFYWSQIERTTIELLFHSLLIALLATIAEALSKRGFDNITIPASVLGTLILTERYLSFL